MNNLFHNVLLGKRRIKICFNQAFLGENMKTFCFCLHYVILYSKSSTFYCNKIEVLVEKWVKDLNISLQALHTYRKDKSLSFKKGKIHIFLRRPLKNIHFNYINTFFIFEFYSLYPLSIYNTH